MGGVQSVLQQHLREDARWGLDSRVVVYFEPDNPAEPRVRGLGLTWRSNIGQARRRFRQAINSVRPPRVVAYYNFWGLPFFAGLDAAERRLGVLHTDWPGLPDCLRQVGGLVDGAFCVNHQLLELVRQNWPGFSPERLALLPCPVGLAAPDTAKPPLAGRPLVVGFCGRIAREQKRVDRFPVLFKLLKESGLDFRLEFLGDGPQEDWLKARLAGEPRVVFHGRLAGAAYWQALRSWDAILFVSDYEGIPIALMEAMSLGVVPVYPQIGCGGGEYVRRAAPEFWYRAGELPLVVAALKELQQMPQPALQALRDRCGETVKAHLGDNYLRTFSGFVRQVQEWPRVSQAEFTRRPFYLADHCPFGLLRRVFMDGFWQGHGR
jgi:glycosyltransferase involved in cell wall biosynthesis